MSRSFSPLIVLLVAVIAVSIPTATAFNEDISSQASTARGSISKNGLTRSMGHIFAQCTEESEDIFWCFKVQTAKLLGRALKVHNINVIDGFTIIRKIDSNDTRSSEGRELASWEREQKQRELNFSNRDIENLSMKSLNAVLLERFNYFTQSRQIQINLPRMLAFAEKNSQNFLQEIINYFLSLFSSGGESDLSEGRGKKKDKKYMGMFIAAVMLKAAILKMAYHSIAIIAGKALIVGKIALIISAIIGLKKLVSGDGGEKTTYEIVKHPQVQQSHTYSSSHAGEYEGGHESGGSEGGSYHRSIDDEMMMQDKAYHAWVPTTKIS